MGPKMIMTSASPLGMFQPTNAQRKTSYQLLTRDPFQLNVLPASPTPTTSPTNGEFDQKDLDIETVLAAIPFDDSSDSESEEIRHEEVSVPSNITPQYDEL